MRSFNSTESCETCSGTFCEGEEPPKLAEVESRKGRLGICRSRRPIFRKIATVSQPNEGRRQTVADAYGTEAGRQTAN